MPRCPDCHRRLRRGAACPLDGGIAPGGPAPSVSAPPLLPGFALGDLIGAGGAAAVWAASDAAGEPVALKVAHGAGEATRIRFAREAEILAALPPPHAPRLHRHGLLADGRPWIAMELIEGRSLADELAELTVDPPASPDLAAARALGDAVLAAAGSLHQYGVVHADLKPENVLVRRAIAGAPLAALIDFGLAAAGGAPAPAAPGWTHGTLGYMAPEVLAGAAPDARADVYALGVILYELFTARVPFAAEPAALEHAHLALRPPPPGLFAALPRVLDELVLACLAKDPERRPPDAIELRRLLRAAAASSIDAAIDPAPDRPASARAEPPRERVLVALAWIEAEAGPARIAAELARTPGELVRQHGRTALALFDAAREGDPARAALTAAARLLATWGGRAALHVDRVDLERRGGRPPAAHGAAIDRPAGWLPPEPWSGLLLTRDLVDAIGDVAVIPADAAGFFTPAGARAPAPPPLVGRAGVLDSLAAGARACFAARRPALVLLLGGPGSGKSRLVAELAAADLGADRLVYEIAARARPLDRIDGEALRARARGGPLAVLVDDVHLADDAVLASLEYATLGGAGAPLWILVAADGRALDQMRPSFGQRAAQHERIELEPLTDDAMRQLAASLLFPADYLPAAVLDRLAVLAGGNPGRLSELVRALKREGAVRPRSDRRSHQLAIEAIERVPVTAAGRWEASRALDALPPELAASARVAAAFGPLIDEAELDWVEDALERDGEGSFFDARVALHALASRDLVVDRGGGSWAFASPLVQDAIYQAMPAGQRAGIHRHALGYWRGRGGARAHAAVARHAGLAGAEQEALAAALDLADGAAALHRDVEAERWYSVALEHVGAKASRVRALVGLARARWRLDRAPEALADLAAARALAREVGPAELGAVLLDEAMVLDWCGDLDGSAARVEEARPLIDDIDDAGLSARLLVATGRTRWRQGHWAEALAPLTEGGERAADIETRLIALLLSGSALSWAGRLEEAEAAMAEAEKLARATDDRLHLCVLHVNGLHPLLWAAGEPSERGADELRRAVQLARELGHPGLERAATHNLAEILHFAGRDDEAFPLAIRSFELQQRFMAESGPEDALLLCRIAVALGDRESAARHLAWLEAHAPRDAAPAASVFHRALDLLQRGGAAEAWDAVVADARTMLPIEFLEILYLRAASELDRDLVDQARATVVSACTYLHRFPSWRERFDRLGAGTAAWGTMQQRAQ